MGKFGALFAVFRRGVELTNADAWQKGLVTVPMVVGFLSALATLAHAFGYAQGVQISDASLADIAGGVLAVAGIVASLSHAASSARVGLPGLNEHPAVNLDAMGNGAKGGAAPNATGAPAPRVDVSPVGRNEPNGTVFRDNTGA